MVENSRRISRRRMSSLMSQIISFLSQLIASPSKVDPTGPLPVGILRSTFGPNYTVVVLNTQSISSHTIHNNNIVVVAQSRPRPASYHSVPPSLPVRTVYQSYRSSPSTDFKYSPPHTSNFKSFIIFGHALQEYYRSIPRPVPRPIPWSVQPALFYSIAIGQ